MRPAIAALVILAAGCVKQAEPACDPEDCGPFASCAIAPNFARICTCHEGFVAANSAAVPCMPRFESVTMNGTPIAVDDAEGDRFAVVHLEVPAGTLALEVEAHAVLPSILTTIDGALVSKITRPFSAPFTRLDIALTDPTGRSERRIAVLARAVGGYTRAPQLAAVTPFGSVALSGDGRLLAAGSSTTNCISGPIALFEGAEWADGGVLTGSGCWSRSIALSHDGTVLASEGDAVGVRMWRQLDAGWAPERVPANLAATDLEVSADGKRLWAAQDGASAVGSFSMTKVGAEWVLDVQLTAKGDAISASTDGALVAVGSADRSTVRVLARSPDGYLVLQDLVTGAGFGADVALSADGNTLIVASRDFAEHAQIFERTATGYRLVHEVTPPVGFTGRPPRPAPTAPLEGVTVEISGDGATAGVGFPDDASIAIVERVNGQWRLRDVLLPPPEDAEARHYGLGLALSDDGERLAVTCQSCGQQPTLSVYDRH